MKTRGQVVLIVAIVIPIAMLLLAVAVDAGRLYIERARLQRAAQAAANAGISKVAEQIAVLAAPRIIGDPASKPIAAWLLDEDRQALVQDPLRQEALAVAQEYAKANGLEASDPDVLELRFVYPQEGYSPSDENIRTLRMHVVVRRKTIILLAGLLAEQFVELTAEALSEVAQR